MAQDFYDGRRLSYEGNLCAVRYIGEVANTKGLWLGVEWDDPLRGKHDGSHNGIKYFSCLSGSPSAGSFVRPTRPHERAVNFVTAIRNKYAAVSQNDSRYIDYAATDAIRISGKEVEEVGFEKVRMQLANLKELRVIILDHLRLARPGVRSVNRGQTSHQNLSADEDVASTCPKVSELDISGNLFEEWDEVVDICRQLPMLTTLKADRNRFRTVRSSRFDSALRNPPFANLEGLSLDDTLLKWSDIAVLIESFPNLLSLSASGNEMTSLPDLNISPNLTSLSLERNSFVSLDQLEPLKHIVSLQRLNIKANVITSVKSKDTKSVKGPQPLCFSFPSSLCDVDISYNDIDDWTFIDALEQVFPGLLSLRVSGNPLYTNVRAVDGRKLTTDDGYMLTIARVGKLNKLNFSHITDKERLNAEAYYLSQIAQELGQAPYSDRDVVRTKHPRFAELCSIYGEPVVKSGSRSDVVPNSLASKLVNITFNFSDDVSAVMRSANVKYNILQLELPYSFTIYNVQGIVGKTVGVSPMALRLDLDTEEEEVVKRFGDAIDDDELEEEELDNGLIVTELTRKETMVPRTRHLGTWITGAYAKIRVELNKEDLTRNVKRKEMMLSSAIEA